MRITLNPFVFKHTMKHITNVNLTIELVPWTLMTGYEDACRHLDFGKDHPFRSLEIWSFDVR
jgi:hypothetical protein